MKGNSASKANANGAHLLEDLIPVREAAEALAISESTAWRWINKHLLPAYRVGQKRIYVKRSDLAPLIKVRMKEESRPGPKPRGDRLSEAGRKSWLPRWNAGGTGGRRHQEM